MPQGPTILILGARSWIGFRLAEAVRARIPHARILGTSSSPEPVFPDGSIAVPELRPGRVPRDFVGLIQSEKPALVFNLLRGEDETAFESHVASALASAACGARYVFSSSAMALDGLAPSVVRDEDVRPVAASAYGRFKVRCEAHLQDAHPQGNWQVLRFASIQGWSPWKASRNEAFLRRLASGEKVVVDQGIFQNRLLDTAFAHWTVDLALHAPALGILHLGTLDHSEEHEFLSAVASDFGLDPSAVTRGGSSPRRLDLSCHKARQWVGGRHDYRESDTRAGLLSEPHLRAWARV